MLARLSAFVIWALIAGTVVFWGLRLVVQPPAPPRHSVVLLDPSAGRVNLTRLFGVPPVVETVAAAPPAASSRFKLIGIMAPRARGQAAEASRGGLALIAVDGKPARAYAVGAFIDPGLVLQSVSLRTASIGAPQGGQTVLLEIPPFAPPNTGVPPSFDPNAAAASALPGGVSPGMNPGSPPGAAGFPPPGVPSFPPGAPGSPPGVPGSPPGVPGFPPAAGAEGLGSNLRPNAPPGAMGGPGMPPGVAIDPAVRQ